MLKRTHNCGQFRLDDVRLYEGDYVPADYEITTIGDYTVLYLGI